MAVQTHEITEIRAPYCLASSHSLVFTTAKVARMPLKLLELVVFNTAVAQSSVTDALIEFIVILCALVYKPEEQL